VVPMKASDLTRLQFKVKPCAFCGEIGKLSPMPNASGWWRVRCQRYDCGGTTWAMSDAEQAVAAWNRRAGDESS